MTFKKNHRLGFLPKGEEPLDKNPLQIKVRKGLIERIKAIPNWQDKLRVKLEDWLAEWERDV